MFIAYSPPLKLLLHKVASTVSLRDLRIHGKVKSYMIEGSLKDWMQKRTGDEEICF